MSSTRDRRGWVKLWRALNAPDSKIRALKYPYRWVAVVCLLEANWQNHPMVSRATETRGKIIMVPRGSFITSERGLVEVSGVPRQVLRYALRALTNIGFLTRNLTQGYSHIYITNFDYWQSDDPEANPAPNPPPTQEQPRSNPGATLIKETKKERTEEGKDLSFSLQSDRPKTKRSRKAHRDPATLEIVDRVVGAFNDTFGRKLGAAGFYDVISRCLGAGYVDAQLRGVVWWSAFEWPEDHDYRGKLSPTTLFKMQGGNRCFPTYLALATEHWPKIYPGKALPWPNQ